MLPDPPLLERLFLEEPWPLTVGLILLAAVLGVLAYQRLQKKLTIAALVAALLAVAIGLTAKFVETDREQVRDATEQLVAATAPMNLTRIRGMLDPDVVLIIGDDEDAPIRIERLLAQLEAADQRYPIDTNLIKLLEAQSLDAASPGVPRARTLIDVLSIARNGRALTRWQIDWEKQPGGVWRVKRIQWLQQPHPMGVSPSWGWLRD